MIIKNKSVRRIEFVQQCDKYDMFNLYNGLNTFSYIKEYAYIIHDKDKDDLGNYKAKHFHCIMSFNKPVQLRTIANHFKTEVERLQFIKSKGKGAYRYLLHLDNKEKFQYDINDVCTNIKEFSLDWLDTPIDNKSNSYINEVLTEVINGNVRPYEIDRLIDMCGSVYNYSKIRSKILDCYSDYCNSVKSKDIEVIFIFGSSGKGKTTFAKYLAGDRSFCISSSSNDLLEEYNGEDILILDDLRHYNIDFVDFLKLTDNNTRSSFKSRYHNKKFLGSTIIITTTEMFGNWYNSDSLQEQRLQFERRISRYYVIKGCDIENNIFYYDCYDNINNKFININEIF